MTTDERLDALTAKVDQALRGLALLVNHLGAGPRASGVSSGGAAKVASDADLDGQYGNPEVKKNPPRWKGESFVGSKMSECSPDFLDTFADFKDYCATGDREAAAALTGDEKSKKLKYAGYGEKDASLARGWAARKRADDGGL